MDNIVRFFMSDRVVTDALGYSVESLLNADDNYWERCHGFIQNAFPTREMSAYNVEALLVTDETVEYFKDHAELRDRQVELYYRFIRFLNNVNWVTSYNHNYLRVTRVIKSMALLGSRNCSDQLYSSVMKLYDLSPAYATMIGETTHNYWKEAYENL